MNFKVTLTPPEMWLAGMTGLARYINARVNNRKRVNGQISAASAGDHVLGAMAELAVAKHYGLYWAGAWSLSRHEFKLNPDVGPFEVRHTAHDTGHLLLQKLDTDNDLYLLVTGEPPELTIRGSMTGREGKQDKWWNIQMRRHCFAIPQEALSPPPPVRGK